MKGVFVIMDGVADGPCSVLNGKTPLEAAKTPNLDELANKSKIDYCYTVKEGVAPESSQAIMSLLGYDPAYIPRGPLEAKGMGIKVSNGDLVFRCNFATIDDLNELNLLDRRAGRTLSTKEAKILAKAINEEVNLGKYKFRFYSGVQHRGVLVIRGGFSDNISNVDPSYGNAGAVQGEFSKLQFSRPLDDEEDSKLSSDLINSFVRQSFNVLDNHPINIARAKKGLYSANVILCRGAGSSTIRLKKLPGKWIGLGYMPLEIGINELVGMKNYKFRYPKLKGIDVYGNLYAGLSSAIKHAKRMIWWYKNRVDYIYIHFKETDIPGHDNKPFDKVKMIEQLDSDFFSYLKKVIGDKKLVITADHTTSCSKKAHTSNPVPVLTYPSDKESEKRFTEIDGFKGRRFSGRNLLKNHLF